jgi:Tfp pilus assembly protein PilN
MIKINLLARKVSKKKAGAIQHLVIAGVVVVACLAVMGWLWLSQTRELAVVRAEIAKGEAEKERLKDVNEKKAKFEKDKADRERKLAIITRLQNERIVPVHLLDDLTRVLDAATPIWLSSYSYTPSGVTLEGISLSHEALRPFVDGLEKSSYYKDVELLYSERTEIVGREVFRFSVKAAVEQPG